MTRAAPRRGPRPNVAAPARRRRARAPAPKRSPEEAKRYKARLREWRRSEHGAAIARAYRERHCLRRREQNRVYRGSEQGKEIIARYNAQPHVAEKTAKRKARYKRKPHVVAKNAVRAEQRALRILVLRSAGAGVRRRAFAFSRALFPHHKACRLQMMGALGLYLIERGVPFEEVMYDLTAEGWTMGPTPRGDVLIIGRYVVILLEGDEREHGPTNPYYWTGSYVTWLEKERELELAVSIANVKKRPMVALRLNLHSKRRWKDMYAALARMEAFLKLPRDQLPQAGKPLVEYFGYSPERLAALASARRPTLVEGRQRPAPRIRYEDLPAWMQLEVDAARALPGYGSCRLDI
eukprot:tig00021015_g17173.t1